jgi:hypothetical protein
MSGLFSSKTKSSTTQSTKVPQNFQNFLNMSLDKAASAGSQGFTQYQAPRIAELSANEQAGTQAAAMNAGMYQPLVDMAGQATANNLASNGAPTQPELDQFINPYVNYVLGNSLDRLRETSDTNMTKIGSTAAMSGAFGGLRHGVLEGANLAELLKSARDVSSSTYSDAFDKGMGNWFKSKDLQRGNISDALNVARQGQAYNTQDIQNLMSTGLTGRTRDQALLDFGYSEFMREDQDDINKASFLSTIAAQYPRDLFTKNSTTETTQTDSPIKTLAGIGLAAAGIMSGNPAAAASLAAGAQSVGQQTTYRPDAPVNKIAKGGLVKKYADGGMIKAGLSIAAGEDPLAAYSDYQDWMDSVEPENKRFIGGMLASGYKMEPKFGPLATWFTKGKKNQNPQEQEAELLPVVQKQPFNWDSFIQNMRLNQVGQAAPGRSPLDSFNQMNPNFLRPRTQTFTPQAPNVNVTPLNPGIPGPGGPANVNFAGGGHVGPQEGWELNVPEEDDSNWLALLGLDAAPKKKPYRGLQSHIRNDYPRYGEELGDLSYLQADLDLLKTIAKQKDYVKKRPLLSKNDEIEKRLSTAPKKSANPLDAMIADMLKEPQPEMGPLDVGADGNLAGPIDEREVRAVMNHLRAVEALDQRNPFPEFTKRNPNPVMEYFNPSPKEELDKKRLNGPGRPSKYDNENTRANFKYREGGAVKKFQEGNFVEGGSSFKGRKKSQARVPAEGIDPLAAIYYGMNSNHGTFKPDFENLGRDDVLADVAAESFGEGTITKAQARNQGRASAAQTPRFESPQAVIDSLPMDPNVEKQGMSSTPVVPRTYSNSRMWDNVNEDLFLEGTKANEQDNRIKNKLLSTNPDTQAFSQYQFTPKTWNEAVSRIDPEIRKKLNINPVVRSEIKKYESGDERLASVLPSQEAVDYVYKTDYLPQSYNNLKKANVPITELNLYLAHHLGYNGAPSAIPLLYDEKYKDTPMKDVLYKAGLKSAATRKGNPWSYDKNPNLTFAQYRAMKEKAYNNLREKYKGKTLDELTPEDIPLNDPSRGGETIDGGTTTFNPIKIIGDSYTKGGMGFSGGGYVKKFAKGGSTDEPLYRAPLEDWDEVFRRQYGDDSLVLPLEDWEKFMPAPPEVTADEIDLYKSIPKGNRANLTPNKVNVVTNPNVTIPEKPKRGPNILRMPENPADWKTREPGIFEKAIERARDPKIGGWMDDFMHDITGGWATPSTSGKRPTDQKIVLPIDEKGWDYKPNPNLYMDALGEWGPNEDPVDAFYKEMGDKIGYPTGEQQGEEVPGGGGVPGAPGAPGGSSGGPSGDGSPLENEYNKMLEEYLAYKKPEKGKVFGLFSDVNEPLLKLGLSLLASKGSFGEALGEAGLASLKDREIEQFRDQKEKSDKLKEILDIRYKQAQMDAMDPSNKLALAQAQAGYRQDLQELKLKNALDMIDLKGAAGSKRAILEGLIKKAVDDPSSLLPEEVEYLQQEGWPITPVQDPGTSL